MSSTNTMTHPAVATHHAAAASHVAAANLHHEAAHAHVTGKAEDAKKSATKAHEHSDIAQKKTVDAHSASQK